MYNNNSYTEITKLLSFSLFFHTLNMVPYNLLVKKKMFKELGIRSIFISIISGLISIALAKNGFSYYSLIIKSVIESILTFTINFHLAKIKLFKSISFEPFKKIFTYSIYQFLFNINNFLTTNLDTLFIGKFLGPSKLGFYDRAFRLSSTFSSLTMVFSSVLHPVLAEHQKNIKLIKDVYLKIFKLLLFASLPLSIFFSFNSREIILIFYGPQWSNSIPIFKYLAYLVFANIIISSSISIFQVLEAVRSLFVFGLLNLLLMIISIYLGIKVDNSIISVAYYITLSNLLMFTFYSIFIFIKLLKFSFIELLSNIKDVIVISAILLLINFIINEYLLIDKILLSLLVKSIIHFIILYVLAIYFKFDKEVLKLFRERK